MNTFAKFYVCDTVPEVAEKLVGLPPFQVLDTTPILVDKYARQFGLQDLLQDTFYGTHKVYVASQSSPEKIEGTAYAFSTFYPFASVTTQFAPKASKPLEPVNEQPTGFSETLQGALNRMDIVDLQGVREPNTWLLSVESGAFLQPYSTDKYHDQAVVVLKNLGTNRTFYTCTHPVELDEECLAASKKDNYQSTAGKYIALKYNCSATNWHKSLTGVSRVDLIKEAIRVLLYAHSQ